MAVYDYDRFDFPTELYAEQDFLNLANVFFDESTKLDSWHAAKDALEHYLWDEWRLVLDDYFAFDRDYGEWYDATL
jgi:hypothetical protein